MSWPLALGQLNSPAVYAPQGGSPSVIQSIQKGTITIAAGLTSNTATISSVITGKSMLVYEGLSTTNNASTRYDRLVARIELTNGTTVTATRGVVTGDVTVSYTVVEFASGVNSIQSGSIVIAATTNTATISAVGANAFVLWLGATTAANPSNYTTSQGAVELTNSTTVTATCAVGGALTVNYMVVDLDSTIVTSVQKIARVDTSASTSFTSTISSVVQNNALVFYNGFVTAPGGTLDNNAFTGALTAATTVTFTRFGTGIASKTLYATVVEFAATALNSAVQRGTIALAASTSTPPAIISSVVTGKSFVNWGNFLATNVTPDVALPRLDLTNATTVTMTVNTAGSPTGAYEVIEFK